jgi:hypothetical protein
LGTHWISFAKITGPLVPRLRHEMLRWTSKPADGDEPQWVNGDTFLVKEPTAIARMQSLAHLFEAKATAPPIVHFERVLDPWTVCPILTIYGQLRGRDANLRIARSDVLDYLLMQPCNWSEFIEQLRRLRADQCTGNEHHSEYELLISHLFDCANSWETLLAKNGIARAILLIGQAVGGSWLDEEVVANSTSMPVWYDN